MLEPMRPVDEDARLAELAALGIMDTSREDRFDRLVRLAARVLEAPMAALSFVDADREWFKSVHGWAATQLPRGRSLAAHAITGSEPFVVPDLREDERFDDHPLATARPAVAFYAAVPVRGPSGGHLGALSVMDRRPRELDAEALQTLRELGRLAEDELEVRLHQNAPRRGPASSGPLQDLLHFLPEPAAAMDAEGRVLFRNEAWRRVAKKGGLVVEDGPGSEMLAALRAITGDQADDAQRLAEGLESLLRGERDTFEMEHRLEGHPMRAVARRLGTADQGALVVHLDLREEHRRKEAEQKVLEMGLELEGRRVEDRYRRRSVERLAKEINTPITPVRLQLPLLVTGGHGELNERQRRALESIVRNVGRWDELTRELIQLERSGPAVARTQRFDLRAVAKEAVALERPAALQAGISLDPPGEGPEVPVESDEELVRQILVEFLEHAFDQTGSGGRIDVDLLTEGKEATVVVRDSGQGMRPLEAQHAFRADLEAVQRPGGLRLAQCGLLAARIGARCEARSEGVGRGTQLRLHLPQA